LTEDLAVYRFSICCIGLYRRLEVGRPSDLPAARELAVVCGLQIRDTAQRGGAATKSSSSLTARFTTTRTRTRRRDSRGLRRFGQILIERGGAVTRSERGSVTRSHAAGKTHWLGSGRTGRHARCGSQSRAPRSPEKFGTR